MLCIAGPAHEARGDAAVSADIFAPTSFALGLNFTAGWRFTVDHALAVTHLGLYDWQGDGFGIPYPVAIWNGQGDVVVQAEVPAGTSVPLVGGFRYMALKSASEITLHPGETYTIGYHQTILAGFDRAIHFNGSHQFSPMVNQVGSGWISGKPSPSISMPDQAFLDFEQWFGPSFQFTVVPAPQAGGAMLTAFALLGFRQRRRCN